MTSSPFAQPAPYSDSVGDIPGPRGIVADADTYGGYGPAAYFALVDQVATIKSTEQRQEKAQALFAGNDAEIVKFLGLVQINMDRLAEDTAAERRKAEEQAYEYAAAQEVARDRLKRERAAKRINGDLSEPAKLFMEKLRAGMMTGDQLDDMQDPTPVVEGWLYEDTINWIAGPSGTFKSFVAHDLAARYASEDMSFHGIPMAHGKVLYIVAEGAGMFKFRKQAWEHFNGKVTSNITYYGEPIQISDLEEQMPALIAFAKEGGYSMVIFDTQAMCTVGDDENQAKDMGVIVNACHSLREATRGCIVLVHHFDKGGNGMRGSGAQFGAAHTVIATKREGDEEWVRLSTKKKDGGKAKDDEGRDDLRFKMERYEPEGGRGSLCPLRDDSYREKVKPVFPAFDQERTDMLKMLADLEIAGGVTDSGLAQWLNEHYPKDDSSYKANGAVSRGKTLLTHGVAEKKGSKWIPTELGRQAVQALSDTLSDAVADD